jgi:hypothetical protein
MKQAYPSFATLPARRPANQGGVGTGMVRTLRQWPETHQLAASITGVAGALRALSMLICLAATCW